jgi:1,4-alpha-glucan branching enzyme
LFFSVSACQQKEQGDVPVAVDPYQPKPYVLLKHPEWTSSATIYEVNIRQFTPEGTFKAFESHLPRLKEMGIDILWLMPIHPIGEKNRKGKLGSYYAVRDYYGVNPEFGNKEDLKALVKKAHEMGMHVILDWVANHSSWDNALVKEHPEWYIKNRAGNFEPTPWRDYDDIVDFDYNQPGIRKYMTEALLYWVKEFDIDGYRCDVASFIPIDFWENARHELENIKPVFMLAESMEKDLHRSAFDMTYAWTLWDHLHAIARQDKNIKGLTEGYIAEHVSIWPRNGYRMNFIDNHDKNSWEGNQYSNFGDALKAAMVLCGTMDGMPMVYSGQEAGLARSLDFFDRDPIEWMEHENFGIYKKLFNLKHTNKALRNGEWGGEMERIKNNKMEQVISFAREKDGDKVVTIVNLSKQEVNVVLESVYHKGRYTELFSGTEYELNGSDSLTLKPWTYFVLSSTR